jgi:hypothetical protein
MSTLDDEKDEKNKKHEGSGRPATKFMERPKPGKKGPPKANEEAEDIGGEQYWGQGRQQKEGKDRQPGE